MTPTDEEVGDHDQRDRGDSMTGDRSTEIAAPRRIQRKRAKGWRMPEGAVYVGRPSKWGNPCHAGMWRDYTHADAVRDFARWLKRDSGAPWYVIKPPTTEEIQAALRGKDLACWCAPDAPCHADVLIEIANGSTNGEER